MEDSSLLCDVLKNENSKLQERVKRLESELRTLRPDDEDYLASPLRISDERTDNGSLESTSQFVNYSRSSSSVTENVQPEELQLNQVKQRRYSMRRERPISNKVRDETETALPSTLRKRNATTAVNINDFKVPVTQLKRGGFYVQTSKFPIQFGIPKPLRIHLNLDLKYRHSLLYQKNDLI